MIFCIWPENFTKVYYLNYTVNALTFFSGFKQKHPQVRKARLPQLKLKPFHTAEVRWILDQTNGIQMFLINNLRMLKKYPCSSTKHKTLFNSDVW